VRENGVQSKRIVKVFENRVSPLLVNGCIVASLAVVSSMRMLPYCVICDALFLFMGVTGLPGNQLFERLKLMVTEPALYPALPFTRAEVPRLQMHLFTAVQFAAAAVLFLVEESPIALAFPIFLLLTIPLRHCISRLTFGVVSEKTVNILDHKEEAKVQEENVETRSQSTVCSINAHHSKNCSVKSDAVQECLLEQGDMVRN
jgi:hypothetical protein